MKSNESEPERRQRGGPDYNADPAAVRLTSAEIWFESSRSLHALCSSRGIRYIHVLQPALHDEGSKIVSPGESEILRERGSQESVREGYPLLRELGEELERLGIDFWDATGVFEGRSETLYQDSVHFTGSGQRVFSDALAARLLQSL